MSFLVAQPGVGSFCLQNGLVQRGMVTWKSFQVLGSVHVLGFSGKLNVIMSGEVSTAVCLGFDVPVPWCYGLSQCGRQQRHLLKGARGQC